MARGKSESKSESKFESKSKLRVYMSILSISNFMWSGALDSSGVLLPYSKVSLASHITTILISTLKNIKHIYLYFYLLGGSERFTNVRTYVDKAFRDVHASTDMGTSYDRHISS